MAPPAAPRTIVEAAAALRRGDATSVGLTRAALDRIAATDDRVKAFITVTAERALEQAAAADALLARGEAASPLAGVPIALKDVLMTEGVRTTAGSGMLGDLVPPYDATAVARLRGAGAPSVGKANMDEFAMGSSTEHSAWFPTANPWDLDRVPGGSSGGSAAAVAAGQCFAALGSDTGGSIRQPAAFCGVVGMKPTYGAVSRYGLIAFASSLDQIGPFTRTVEDAALLLQAIAAPDPLDATCSPEPRPGLRPPNSAAASTASASPPRASSSAPATAAWTTAVAAAVAAAVDALEANGASVDRGVEMPTVEHALPVYYVLAPSECSANLARYDGAKYGLGERRGESMWDDMEATRRRGFGPEVKRRILLGAYALSAGYYDAWYLQAQKVRTVLRREFDRVFAAADLIVAPTTPTVAFRRGEITDPYQMYLNDIYTIPANIAGLPAISLPCGAAEHGMPVGLQLIADRWREPLLFRAAHAYERVSGWNARMPELSA